MTQYHYNLIIAVLFLCGCHFHLATQKVHKYSFSLVVSFFLNLEQFLCVNCSKGSYNFAPFSVGNSFPNDADTLVQPSKGVALAKRPLSPFNCFTP